MCDHISYAEKSKGVDPPRHKYRRFPGGVTAGAPESNQIFHVDLGYVWKCGGRCVHQMVQDIAPRCFLSHIRARTLGRFLDVLAEVSRAGYTGG